MEATSANPAVGIEGGSTRLAARRGGTLHARDRRSFVLLTRSIRRKLAFSLGVMLLMLTCLAGAGLSGLASYQRLVKQLEIAVKETM